MPSSIVRAPDAPPVVAAMVVSSPGEWFDEVLAGLAAQDYPNLQSLFFVIEDGSSTELSGRIRASLPNAIVRMVEGNPGWGPVQNQVLRLVEGDSGFFCFLHDDVALEPTTISRLIEETFRSNAGLVGPKVVTWDDPRVLQEVGIGVDRLGERVSAVESGEVDQEQHDAVRDVFTLSSCCLLVRADLFRDLGGFCPEISFHGEELDLSWRVHLSGARVLVVPAARVRHRGDFASRNPHLRSSIDVERHRVLTVLSLTSAPRVPGLYLQMVVESLVRVIVSLVGGGARSAFSSLRATLTAIFWMGQIWSRRSRVREARRVSGSEIRGLQERGSARLTAFIRRRTSRRASRPTDDVDPRHTRFVLGVGVALAVVLLVGSRSWIGGAVPAIGEFLPLRSSESPFALLGDYLGGWWQAGFGQATANPTGVLLLALAGFATFGQMGFLQLCLILGLVVCGWIGVWQMAGRQFGMRTRILAVIVYGAMPNVFFGLGAGAWGALVVYAGLPWWARAFMRDQQSLGGAKRTQAVASSVVLAAVVLAFEPSALLVFGWVGVWWALANVLAGNGARSSIGPLRVSVIGAVGAFILNLPSAIDLIARPANFVDSSAEVGHGLLAVASLDFDARTLGVLTVVVHLLPLAAILLARGAHVVWAVRAVVLSGSTTVVMVLRDRGVIEVALPSGLALSFVVTFGAALAVLALMGMALDRERSRLRPFAIGAVAVGLLAVVPSLPYATSGDWGQPETTLAQLLTQLPKDPDDGDYRVAFVGESGLLPLAPTALSAGLHYAVSDDGEITLRDRWIPPANDASTWLEQTLELVGSGSTVRAGRLLAPLAVRYVVVPLAPLASTDDENASTAAPIVRTFVDGLANQLDMRRAYFSSSLVIYENVAWIPTLTKLSDESAVLSEQAGTDALLTVDLDFDTVLRMGETLSGDPSFVEEGTVHFAAPHSDSVVLNVGGIDVQSRVAFGGTMAFDSPVAGLARLELRTPWFHLLAVFVQVALWVLAVLAIGDIGRFRRRSLLRKSRRVTLLDSEDVVLSMNETPRQP